ncbi:RcnB family protein [Phenylobacterium terrae]|uniref:RcnB family protein n=1 Tax=Phenylobacterium terrae TaxID=2665495 RepID=A0ABW4N6T4_9CAUL
MRRTLLAFTAAAVALTGAAAAQAQPLKNFPGVVLIDDDDDWDDWRKERRERAKELREREREAYKDWREDQRERAKDLREAQRDYYKAQRKYERAQRRWSRGQYLPAEYRSSRYIIHDYRAYRLPPPPRGYGYVRHDDDVLLTSLASGLITQVLADILR